jgi:methyl-accepting chemotaxis protein
VTQENSATSEQSAGAAEELSSQAESLRNIIQLLIEAIRGQQNQNLVNSAVRLSVHQESPKPHPTHSSKVPGTKKQESSHSSENGQWKGLKGALGLEPQGIPSKNDPRFQDV